MVELEDKKEEKQNSKRSENHLANGYAPGYNNLVYESEDPNDPQTWSAVTILNELNNNTSRRGEILLRLTQKQQKKVLEIMERTPELQGLYENCKKCFSFHKWVDLKRGPVLLH